VVPTVVRQRREIGRLKKTAAQLAALPASPPVAPATEPPATDASGQGAQGEPHGV